MPAGGGGANPEPPAGAAPASPRPGIDDAKRAKRAAAAAEQKRRRAEKKAKREARAQKAAVKKAQQQSVQASLAPAPTTSPADQLTTRPDGWPTEQRQAACMPAAVAMLQQFRFVLGPTRYGAALDPREVDIPDPKTGKTKPTVIAPIEQSLAPPLAAWLATSDAQLTPGKQFLVNFGMLMVPVAGAHAVAAIVGAWERAQERRERAERERENDAGTAPAPKPPEEKKPERPNGVVLRAGEGAAKA